MMGNAVDKAEGAETVATRPDDRLGRAGYGAATYFAFLAPAAIAGGMAIAPLQALCGLAVAPFSRDGRRIAAFLLAAAPLLAFAVWAAVSHQWSPVPRPEQAAKVVGGYVCGVLFVAGLAASGARNRALGRASLVAAVIVLICVAIVEAGGDLVINRMGASTTDPGVIERNPGKGVSILVAVLWGAVGALIGGAHTWQRLLWRALLVIAGLLSLQFGMATNAAGFAVGFVGFCLGWMAPRIAPIIIAAGLAGWMLVAPWASVAALSLPGPQQRLPLSWQMRGEIWRYAGARIDEKLLTGWGLDGARKFGTDRLAIGDTQFQAIPLHPHSFSLHVWLETGLVGASLAALSILTVGIVASRTLGASKAAGAAAAGALATVGAIWNVSYGAWQEWWIAAAFTAAAAAALARR
jgi:O-antigen ligase